MLDLITRQPLVTGVVLGTMLGVPHLVLGPALSTQVAALTLAMVAGVYIGFAIVEQRATAIVAESVTAVGFACAALGGLILSPWFVVAAFVAHGVWDWVHHHHAEGDGIAHPPRWYPPFCLAVDWTFAVLLGASIWYNS